MTNSTTNFSHFDRSGARRSNSGGSPSPSDKTKRDIGSADDTAGETASELCEGVLLGNRYLVLRRLGRGGFSDVYLAHDHELDRPVAVKRLLLKNVDIRFIKSEAKTLASLDHPSIVRIFDICNDPIHGYLVIMQYVAGPMLRELLSAPLPIQRAVEIAIRISGGLIHAHSRGIVHRDIKPTNILMSGDGEPLIADFGLALAPASVCEPEGGTPRYMSPEQIRNETKRIGPSSDIFSTGVLLYEMLAGQVPFNGETAEAISQATLEQSPMPISTLNSDVPVELDRIVRRALRKNVKDRYNSMEAFQAELIQWLASQETATELSTIRTSDSDRGLGFESTLAMTAFRNAAQITHRGLQPFESEDAKFFLSLLPGAKASSGLPEAVQFWKDWLEGFDCTEYSRVGVLYGPSGSGKTSLLRAGILPNLAPDILPIVLECRKGQKLRHIAATIAQQCNLETQELSQLFLRLRDDTQARGQHRKVIFVLDHFDNWSGSASSKQLKQLAAALRYCDGEILQALLIVREESWIAATEFLRMVDCGVEQWKNARAIELLDRHHARHLLEIAGRSYNSLPPYPEAIDAAQANFVSQAIDEMSDRGRVLPIQLAMFVKMAKLQRWHPDTLKVAGGVQGAYVGYFQDLFESSAAPPSYRRVCAGVVEVLKQLLPSADQTVHSHLIGFTDLERTLTDKSLQSQLHRILSILVEDLRLVVRVSQPGSEPTLPSEYEVQCNDKFHLVHDFLVEPIAIWVDQVQKSSWRGRAYARLEELSAMWGRKQHARYLPTFLEYLAMQIATPFRKRNSLKRRFLMRAGRRLAMQALSTLFIVLAIGGTLTFTWQKIAESTRIGVQQKIELGIHGTPAEFIAMLGELKADNDGSAAAAIPQINSPDDQIRTRARLLGAVLHKSEFHTLMADWSSIEPELSMQVIAAARETPRAKKLVEGIFDIASSSSSDRVRAAITLAHLGDNQPLAELFDFSNSPHETSTNLGIALNWGAEPGIWEELALADISPGATYHALCVLGSFPSSLRQHLNWEKLARLQSNADGGVSAAAAWLLGENPASRNLVTRVSTENRRHLSTGLQQVKIDAGTLNFRHHLWQCRAGEIAPFPFRAVTVDEPFWISASPVTNAEYRAFEAEFKSEPVAANRNLVVHAEERAPEHENHPERACTGWNAILALEYCNWLSRKESLEPVYEIGPRESDKQQPTVIVNTSADGFRLPTLAEILLAASLGSVNSQQPEITVEIFCKSRSLPKLPMDENYFENERLAKDLAPNRKGFQLDMDANAAWCAEGEFVKSLNWSQESPLAIEETDEKTNDFAAIWIVGGKRSELHSPVHVSTDLTP